MYIYVYLWIRVKFDNDWVPSHTNVTFENHVERHFTEIKIAICNIREFSKQKDVFSMMHSQTWKYRFHFQKYSRNIENCRFNAIPKRAVRNIKHIKDSNPTTERKTNFEPACEVPETVPHLCPLFRRYRVLTRLVTTRVTSDRHIQYSSIFRRAMSLSVEYRGSNNTDRQMARNDRAD